MNSLKQSIKSCVAGIALVLYAGAPVYADDIEIYTSLGSAAVSVQPNILFILDSSGSMNEPVTTATVPYDSATVYTGCYNSGRIYYSNSGSTPACNSNKYFYDTSLHCDHAWDEYDATGTKISTAGPLDTAGYYVGQIAQKNNSNTWTSPSTNNNSQRSRPIECKQDQGIHGSNAAPAPNVYITDNATGWTSSATTPSALASGVNNYSLYHYNYLNYLNDPAAVTSSTRFEEMKKSILALTDANSNINIGLMQYDSKNAEGGPVIYAMEDINSARNDFQARVKTMSAGGATPLAETYYEALHYYGGKSIEYGGSSVPSNQTGAKESGDPKFYQTPISSECQKHAIVYLTDGAPTYDHISTSQINEFPGISTPSCADNGGTFDYTSNVANSCLEFMAGWAANNDVAERSIPAHDGEQKITTYTIGFDFSTGSASEIAAQALLQRTADAAGGRFYEAKDSVSLSEVFNKIIAEILAVNTTFSSPAVSVNAFNRSTHLDDLYFTLFKPAQGSHWNGNLKKYKLKFGPDVDDMDGDSNTTETLPFIADVSDKNAISPTSGFFKPTAKSYWSDIIDGDEAKNGGAAQDLTAVRNIYTYPGSYTTTGGVSVPATPSLKVAANLLDKTNAAVTEAMLNITGKPEIFTGIPYRDSLLDWAIGIDIFDDDGDNSTTDARRIMGDPLHAEPALVQYGKVGTDPDLVAFVATNDGYLHAFNSLTGAEYFAFVPQELLTNLDVIFEDTGTAGKSYGLDGNVVAWIKDVDRDGEIESGDSVNLYMGMRRGGNNIYSLDVTDRNTPQLNYVIKGGTGNFTELGQTWSTVNVEKLKISGSERTVLIFGGGYDTTQDSATVRTADTVGRAIYIVDALTGQRMWWAGPTGSGADLILPEMKYSIPARIKPLDINGDGAVDRLYAGDMGGQLWRFDIPAGTLTAGNLGSQIKGGRIADLAQDSSTIDARRFYYPPDVALIFEEGKAPYLSILAASGFRAHPLNKTIHDRMYMIRDNYIYAKPPSYVTLTESDLFDTTDNIIGQGSPSAQGTAVTALNGSQGWYIDFNQADGSWIGEKSLSEPLLLDGVAIVTTFIPEDILGLSTGSCTPREGTGSVFFVNITDGTPTYDLSGDSTKKREDRKTYLKRGGIPPTPNVIITEQGTAQCVGTECAKSIVIDGAQKTYWYEKEQ